MTETNRQNKAVLLLSGGIDSYTTGAVAKERGYELYAISFDYGQRHKIELESAEKIAADLEVKEHKVITLDLNQIGGSALTDQIDVPKNVPLDKIGDHIPITYVPARNIILLSIALSWAEVIGARFIFIGANAVDFSGYPDCRPEFIESFEKTANLATKVGAEGNHIIVMAPLVNMTKEEIIRKGDQLGLDYSLSLSCYDPTDDKLACGQCDSCLLRYQGFVSAKVEDPTLYQTQPKV